MQLSVFEVFDIKTMALAFAIFLAICSNFVLGDYEYSDQKVASMPLFVDRNVLPKSTYDIEKSEKCTQNSGCQIISSKLTQGLDHRQGPQIFIPRQKARISQFRAPDHYNFVPPEQQPYRSQGQVHQHPPVLFIQPEFAVIEPAVIVPPQYPHYLRQLQKQQSYQSFGSGSNNNKIFQNNNNPNVIISAAKTNGNNKPLWKDNHEINRFKSNRCSDLNRFRGNDFDGKVEGFGRFSRFAGAPIPGMRRLR